METMRERVAGAVPRGWGLPVALLLLGGLARLAWVVLFAPHVFVDGEIANVAVAFANTGVLADAFHPGQGPTAHVLPIPPIVAGLIYRAFGVRSGMSEGILVLLATATVLASYALLYRIFGILGTPRWARLGALATTCLLPLNFWLETVVFRIWEGALAVAVGLAFLLALLELERADEIRLRAVAAMALAAALVLFISPAMGVAVYACSLLLMVDRLPVHRWPVTVAIACLGLAVVVVPWSIRNNAAMGEPILLRSDFGLELALGNGPAAAAAVTEADDHAVFYARMQELQPFNRVVGYQAMWRAGGEAAYARALGAETKTWIAEHPAAFARLSLKHLRQYFFPPLWQWNVFNRLDRSSAGRGLDVKIAVHWLIAAAGIAGAMFAMIRAWSRYRYALMMMFLPALPYMIMQPTLRYRYLMYGLSVFFAADLLAYLVARWRSGSSWSSNVARLEAGAPS